MQYRKFGKLDFEASALGFGTMRLPTTDGNPMSKNIDEAPAISMIREAIDAGVNYVDTAHFYHRGASEIVTGKALLDGYREKVKLATKLPVYVMQSSDDFDTLLNKQLEKLQTDHIDFYLLHALNEGHWRGKVLPFGLLDHLRRAKEDGRIRHAGFSFHDGYPVFTEMVDAFPWDFCQIQLNYLNVNYQAGVKGLHYAADSGLPVVVMEPLLGGKLATPPKGVVEIFEAVDPEKSPVEWALDFLWDMPEVSLLLSGMTTAQQMRENVAFASRSKAGMLRDAERKTIAAVQEKFASYAVIPCTGCGYCMPCPHGLNIPGNFAAYNELFTYESRKVGLGSFERMRFLDGEGCLAPNCIACRECEKACPQQIPISECMPKVSEAMK